MLRIILVLQNPFPHRPLVVRKSFIKKYKVPEPYVFIYVNLLERYIFAQVKNLFTTELKKIECVWFFFFSFLVDWDDDFFINLSLSFGCEVIGGNLILVENTVRVEKRTNICDRMLCVCNPMFYIYITKCRKFFSILLNSTYRSVRRHWWVS